MGGDRLVVQADPGLAERMRELARRRLVFVVGLPGTGKSFVVHQLAHLAAARGRRVHLLQWDVARPVFEASPAGRRYPIAGGVTHALVRKAAGLWVRGAVVQWAARHPGPEHLLVGEAPFVGGRFVELARPGTDEAERLLTAPSCRFAIAVPSADVRRFLEAERQRRAATPLHPREREDAPPQVLRDLWRDLVDVARRLGLAPVVAGSGEPAYDPVVYRNVYATLLRHRHVDVLDLALILPTAQISVYDFATPPSDLVPSLAEAEHFIHDVERLYPSPAALDEEIARWCDI